NYHNYRKAQELEALQDLEDLDALEDGLDMEPQEEPEHRKRGGQPGNQNARKYGFYSKLLPPERAETMEEALGIRDFTEDLAVMRLRLAELVRDPSSDPNLINRTFTVLARMMEVQIRYRSW
ncbi:MAG: hypothetical protein OXT51_06600, partial [Chloroflexota bacterium]|nr:hypothetical protein [Chloroflexota bacterium]